MKGRNADSVCFPTKEPHRRCDSEAAPVINFCFTWLDALNTLLSHRQRRKHDVNTYESEYPWLNTCRHVLTAGSWCAKLSKLHKKWDFWLSSPFHCLTAVISHFLEKTQDQKSLQKADLFRHFSQSLALFLLLFLSASCSGSKDIWLWEEEKQPPQIFVSLSYFISMQTYHHQTISFWK